MKLKHEIAEPFRSHIADGRNKIRIMQDEALRLRGQVSLIEQDIRAVEKHLSVVCGLIEKQAELPPSKMPYVLSDDGLTLVGEVEEQHESNPNTPAA